MSKFKKRVLHGQVKKDSFYRQIVLQFWRAFAPVTRQFFAPSLYILYAADFNYLIRWVIVTYLLLDIRVVNSHATSAYACELLAVTSYLPTMNPELLRKSTSNYGITARGKIITDIFDYGNLVTSGYNR